MINLLTRCSSFATKTTVNKIQVNIYRTFYDASNRHNTIYSLSSAIKESTGSPIGVVRVSGNKVVTILNLITKKIPLRQHERSSTTEGIILPRYATWSKIYAHHIVPDEIIDKGLVLWFPKPNSFTGEDVCEFHLHGSQAIISSLLSTFATLEGCRPAEPGEFSRRAFNNQKMDLTMVEGIADLIASKTDKHRKMALSAVSGETKNLYSSWSDQLTTILSHLEASIDFGEDELIGEVQVVNKCFTDLKNIKDRIKKHIRYSSQRSELIRNGIKLAILGPPNAGKSTFMNILCQQDLSIVSDTSGTTRDVIEHSIQLGGFAVKICDTAGLRNILSDRRNTIDPIEEEGMKRAIGKARICDIMLYVVDLSTLPNNVHQLVNTITRDLLAIINDITCYQGEEVNRSHGISIKIILNKMDKVDLTPEITPDMIRDALDRHSDDRVHIIRSLTLDVISCKTKKNLEEFTTSLIDTVSEVGEVDGAYNESDVTYVNERHTCHLNSIVYHLEKASVMSLSSVDLIAQHVRECIDHISRITGDITNEQVLDIIFRDFCIGK